MSFHRRFVVAVVAVTALALGGGSAMVYVLVTRTERAQFDAAIIASARAIAASVQIATLQTVPVDPRSTHPVRGIIAPLAPVAVVYGPVGPPLGPWDPPVPVPARETLAGRDEKPFPLVLGTTSTRAVVIPLPHQPGYRLLYAAPTKEIDLEQEFLRDAMATGFTLALVWTTLVSAFVVRRFTAGIDSISGVVRRVAAGDLRVRVPPFQGDPIVVRLAHDIDDMTGRLDLLVRSQQDFVAHAAHELRTPLASLYGELSLAIRRPREAEEYRHAIEEALDSARRLKDLAEDLLALARLGGSPHGGGDSVVDIEDVVNDAVRVVRGAARDRSVIIQLHGEGGKVRGHRGDLGRVVRNLLENAVRHSPDGATIDVALRHDASDQVVCVTDQGPGVPEEDAARVFEPFFRGSETRANETTGAGLGLAIARGIAREHGGDLRLLASSRGASFELRLPRADVDA